MPTWTLIDEQTKHTVELGEDLRIDPSVLGWELKSEGLCRGEVCVPIPAGAVLDAPTLGRLLQRPVVVDGDARIASFGAAPSERAEVLRSGLAPDFALPDVHGVVHRLSDHRGRKVVLYAYASW